MPSMPLGSRSRISNSSAWLNVAPLGASPPAISAVLFSPLSSVTATPAIMPGMITMNGMNIFGNAPMIGVRRAADMLLAAMARCTSTKFVVQ